MPLTHTVINKLPTAQ